MKSFDQTEATLDALERAAKAWWAAANEFQSTAQFERMSQCRRKSADIRHQIAETLEQKACFWRANVAPEKAQPTAEEGHQ